MYRSITPQDRYDLPPEQLLNCFLKYMYYNTLKLEVTLEARGFLSDFLKQKNVKKNKTNVRRLIILLRYLTKTSLPELPLSLN